MKNSILKSLEKQKKNSTQLFSMFFLFLFLALFIPTQSNAFCVYNNTGLLVNFKIAEHGWEKNNVTLWIEALKFPKNCWNYSDIGSGSRTQLLTIEVWIEAIQFKAVTSMQAGGYLKVDYHKEENGVNETVKVTSYTYDHKVLFVQPNVSNPGNRSVSFLATADPQFVKGDIDDISIEWWRASMVLNKLKEEAISGANRYRGIIVAGDLTQWTRTVEFQEYEKPFKGYTRYLYDGLGNHDYGFGNGDIPKGNCCNGSGSLRGGNFLAWNSACICPDDMAQAIGDRQRSSPLTGRSGPNYSWDWHDVHFVQLNLYPGNGSKFSHKLELIPGVKETAVSYYYNTFNSLIFLITDLKKNVGNSGRPVVLIHHYGFEGFSRGACDWNDTNTDVDGCGGDTKSVWWTQDERAAYWNALADYNVPLIITGHLHSTGINSDAWWKTTWKRPATLTNGPAEIQAITAGGAKAGGYYTSFNINNDKITVNRSQLEMKEPFIMSTTFKQIETVVIPITKPGDKPTHLISTTSASVAPPAQVPTTTTASSTVGAVAGAAATQPTTTTTTTTIAGGGDFKKIQNRWKPNIYLHIENGPIKSGQLGKPDWWSAQWEMIPVQGTKYVQIKNRWKPNIYLHNQHGKLEAGTLGAPGWWSAQWELVPVQGTEFVQIRNRWKPDIYLHIQNGPIEAGRLGAPGWWSAQWKIE